MTKKVSDETQAILDRLKREGDLVRNSGANSIKGVKVELGKFHAVFDQMKQSLSSISSQNSNTATLAQQLANSQAAAAQANQNASQAAAAQQAAGVQKDRQEQIKKDKTEKKERTSWMKMIKGFFGKIFDFFKKAAFFLAGGALAYEFVAGMIEEKFDIDMPTVSETLKSFKETVDSFNATDWESAKVALGVLGGLTATLALFGGALGTAIGGLSSIGAIKDLIMDRRNRTRGPSGIPGTGPTVATTGAPGQGPGGSPTTGQQPSRQQRRLDWKEWRRQQRALGNRNVSFSQYQQYVSSLQPQTTPTAPTPTPTPKPAGGMSWWQRFKTGAKAAKGPALLTGAVTALELAGQMNGEELLDATSMEQDLLDAIENRKYDVSDVMRDAAVSAGTSAVVSGGIGLIGGPAAALAAATAGAFWGGISGLASSSILALRRVYKDKQDEGIDELPNTVEKALREELAKVDTNDHEEAIRETMRVAEKFLDDYGTKLEETQAEIEAQQALIDANTMSPPEMRQAKERLEELTEKRNLLETQMRATENVWMSRADKVSILGQNGFNPGIGGSYEDLGERLAAVGAGAAPQQFFFTQGGSTNNFSTTNMNRSSSLAYRSHVSAGGGNGYGSSWQAIPGMFG